jgi:hypothetical protein
MVKVLFYLEEDDFEEEEIGRGFIIGLAWLLLNPLGLKLDGLKYPVNRLPWPCGEDDCK